MLDMGLRLRSGGSPSLCAGGVAWRTAVSGTPHPHRLCDYCRGYESERCGHNHESNPSVASRLGALRNEAERSAPPGRFRRRRVQRNPRTSDRNKIHLGPLIRSRRTVRRSRSLADGYPGDGMVPSRPDWHGTLQGRPASRDLRVLKAPPALHTSRGPHPRRMRAAGPVRDHPAQARRPVGGRPAAPKSTVAACGRWWQTPVENRSGGQRWQPQQDVDRAE